MRLATISFLLLLLGGCAIRRLPTEDYQDLAKGNLPVADTTLRIPGLMPCTQNPDHSLHLRTGQPVYVLVHGCFGSSGQFRGLAQVLAFHGQQTVCFGYNDRARLAQSATLLRRAINLLAAKTLAPTITIIGHSQGALIAHRSLRSPSLGLPSLGADLRLVTILGPFGGIEADLVFSLAEQRNSVVETDRRARRLELRAGHVEVVGDQRVAPEKLIAVLQEEGAIPPTAPEHLAAFNLLLAQIYQNDEDIRSR